MTIRQRQPIHRGLAFVAGLPLGVSSGSRCLAARVRGGGLLVGLLYAVMSVALMAPAASDTILPSAGDLVPHLGEIVQAKMALEEGQFPPRVAPWQHNGWRYPVWQFYSPFPYTVAALAYRWITPANPYAAYKLTLWLALTVSGIFTCRMAWRLTGSRPAAVLAGAAYMAAPYFLVNIHARGAFPEAVAQGIVPVLVYYSARAYFVASPRPVALAAVCWFALATTHTITFVYSSLFISLWFLLLGGRPRKSAKRLIRVGASYGLGCLLALYFLAPVVSADYLRIRDNLPDPYTRNWLTPLPTLLSPVSVAPEPQPGPHVLVRNHHSAVGWPILLGVGAVVYALVAQRPLLRRRGTLRFVPSLLAVFGLALFTVWSPVDFWALLPKSLYVTQFSYRLLTQVMWAGALLAAYGVALLCRWQLDGRHLAVGLFLIGMASGSWLPSPVYGYADINAVVRDPDIGYGRDDYRIRESSAFYSGVAAETDLSIVYPDGWLMLDHDVDLHAFLPWNSPALRLHLEGDVPPEVFQQPVTLTALLEGQRIASTRVGGGPFAWDVPLQRTLSTIARGREGKPVQLRIVSDRVFRPQDLLSVPLPNLSMSLDRSRPLAVYVRSLVVRGLPPDGTALPVRLTEPSCRQGPETYCSISVSAETGLVQLPVLFYPGLLDVRVDGQSTAYLPLVHRSYVLTGLRLPPGSYDVRVRFAGITWANWVSGGAWLGLIALFVAGSIGVPKLRARVLQPRRASVHG